MAEIRPIIAHRWTSLLAVAFALAAGRAPAQDFTLTDQQFDMWLTNGTNSSVDQVNSQLTMQIQAIDRVCHLQPDQEEKLQLAGRGDVARYQGRVEEMRKKLVGRTYDQNEMNEIWQQIQPLQQEFQAGILNDSSLFRKILLRTLEPTQVAEYEAAESTRCADHYAAKVRLYVAVIERSFPMTDSQRLALIKLMLDKTQAPRRFGQNEIYYVMYQASQIPEEEIAKVFDKEYTRVLTAAFGQGAGYEQFLRQQGFIFDKKQDKAK